MRICAGVTGPADFSGAAGGCSSFKEGVRTARQDLPSGLSDLVVSGRTGLRAGVLDFTGAGVNHLLESLRRA